MRALKNERFFATVTKEVWMRMQSIAKKEDIDRGGLWDARLGVVNVWCSPGDKPEGYDFEIKSDALSYPRNYLASLRAEFEGNQVELYLSVTNYAAEDCLYVKEKPRGMDTNEWYKHWDKLKKGTSEDWKWAKAKFKNLKGRAEKGGGDLLAVRKVIIKDDKTGDSVEIISI